MSSVPNLFGDTSVTIDVGVVRKPASAMLTVLDGPEHPRRLVIGSAEGAALLHAKLGSNGNGNGHGAVGETITLDETFPEQLRDEDADEVYFVLGGPVDEELFARTAPGLLSDGVAIHLLMPEEFGPPVRTTVSSVGNRTCLSLDPVGAGDEPPLLHRLLDLAVGSVLLAVFSPLLVVLALLVRWKMGSPVIYKQKRVGRLGRTFSIFKFRSMVTNAESWLRESPEIYRRYVENNFKLPEEDDPRITPLGRFLRRTSLDELPQLWNVLRGDMSLVGPRPIVPEEVAMYGEYAGMLLRVKPGLTGAWQVTGRSNIPYPERARIDLRYVAGRSLGGDLRLLLQTVPAVLRRRGAV
jgi:lipopolysaccharide/colanic/teichoic acid biosynthesis glycosyltransferase